MLRSQWLKLGALSLSALVLSLSGCATKATTPIQAACVMPSHAQKQSVALFLGLVEECEDLSNRIIEPVCQLYGAAEVLAGFWGRCWPNE